ncbi:hypothetical protein [Vreelandella boliviensis]|uniref:hypothetical protein n=1 Tax=Vreelandella boliviensis TaxID=223527 RepID=UPI001B8C737C|nr:hypothetical protein [Halomonas boliviensis]MBS3667071.1 hypothetical protein [Halomonas boliviensis]
MSIRNFHVDGRVTEEQLLSRSSGFIKSFVASFRQAAANGNFSFGGIKLQDSDLNRVHGIVTEIDSRRLFYACSEDEVPQYSMRSLYEARNSIREQTKGVWATPSCEVIVQEITHALAEACTEAERLGGESVSMGSENYFPFVNVVTNMRLKVWTLIAILQQKVGSIINPRNMPAEIVLQVGENEL